MDIHGNGIDQSQGNIFKLNPDGTGLLMRGLLPDDFLKELFITGEWRFINGITAGLYKDKEIARFGHTVYSLVYIDGNLQAFMGCHKTIESDKINVIRFDMTMITTEAVCRALLSLWRKANEEAKKRQQNNY